MDDKMYSIPSEICGVGIPLGLGVAFSEDLSAMVKFSSLPENKQAEIVALAENLPADGDFRALLNNL